jgi:chemotaxis response regulator CheB
MVPKLSTLLAFLVAGKRPGEPLREGGSSVGETTDDLRLGRAKVDAFPAVAIGASDGGIEALRQLLAHKPDDLRLWAGVEPTRCAR